MRRAQRLALRATDDAPARLRRDGAEALKRERRLRVAAARYAWGEGPAVGLLGPTA